MAKKVTAWLPRLLPIVIFSANDEKQISKESNLLPPIPSVASEFDQK